MGLFNNKDKRADDNAAFDSNNAGQDQSSNFSDRRLDDSRGGNVNDDTYRNDRAYDNNTNNNNTTTNANANASQNTNVPDQRGGVNSLGHQYQDPYSDDPQRTGQIGANQNSDSRYGTNTNTTQSGTNFASGPGNAAGYSAPDQAGVHPYDNAAQGQGQGQGYPAGVGPGAQNTAQAGVGQGGYAGQGGVAATGGGRGGAATYNPTGQVLGYNQGGQSTSLPSKSTIRKDEWLGKLENVAGILLSSESMKQHGAQKEMQAVQLKKQSVELGGATNLEQEAMNRRDRAVGHGAHPAVGGLGATGHNVNRAGGPTGPMSGSVGGPAY